MWKAFLPLSTFSNIKRVIDTDKIANIKYYTELTLSFLYILIKTNEKIIF